jgi:hypothetical protein
MTQLDAQLVQLGLILHVEWLGNDNPVDTYRSPGESETPPHASHVCRCAVTGSSLEPLGGAPMSPHEPS